jgi:ATP-dependent Zn protease
LWDRVKFLLLLTTVWFVLVWAAMADNPLLPFVDAARQQLLAAAWVLVLIGIEVVRQLHFLISEHWARYHRFWTDRVFGGTERLSHRRLSDWTRFRLTRVLYWLCWIAVLAFVLGRIYHTSPVLGLFQAPAALLAALPFVAQVILILFIAVGQFVAIFWFLSRGGVDVYYPDDIQTRFTDVWGQDHVLERVKENIMFLEAPEEIEKKGGYVPGGILLWGPPGTGKTLMAEAVAGETGRPYVFVDPGAFINMFFGVGVLKVKSLFRKLRKLALRYGGVIVFFDEADALGNRGAGVGQPGGTAGGMSPAVPDRPFDACHGMAYLSRQTQATLFQAGLAPSVADAPRPGGLKGFVMGAGMGGGGGMGTLQALLTELSGLKKPRGFINRYVRRALGMRPKPPPKYRILVMMATNLPSALDEALLRPGRIDRIYHVGYPSKDGRKRTYEGYLGKVKNEVTEDQIERLATITPYATGATIKDLVNESLIVALREDRDTITWSDVLKAKLLKNVGPPEGVEYIERERHAVAVHEACHAVVSYLMQRGNVIDTATIQKGQGYLGFVQPIPIEERFTSWRTEYEADIMVSIASLVGERMFFGGDNSSGVSGDLENATRVAMLMDGLWGMGGSYGSYAATKAPRGAMTAEDGTDRNVLETALGRRVEARLERLAEQTRQLIADHREYVLAVAHALETHKTITGEDIVAVVEGVQGPIVDGRIYTLPEFREALEDYHEQALAAHEGREHRMALPPVITLSPEEEPESIAVMRPASPPPPAPPD